MSSAFGRKIQTVIDRIRRKRRHSAPADAFGLTVREARRRVTPTGELSSLYYAHEGRTAQKWDHYLEIYERHFQPLRALPQPRILEIGVSRGGSLELWRKYFGPGARIVGIDIDPACAERVDPENAIVIGDQSDPAVLAAAIDRLGGGVDLVIDDGSHMGRHQIASFEYLYPRISGHGLYVCEDLHCCYWPTYDGGYRREGTFCEHTKTLVDKLHAWFLDGTLQSESMPFASTTAGIHVYLSVIVIEKRPISRPFETQIGKGRK